MAGQGIDVERLARAIHETLYPNWPEASEFAVTGYAPWHADAEKVAAEYARLSSEAPRSEKQSGAVE